LGKACRSETPGSLSDAIDINKQEAIIELESEQVITYPLETVWGVMRDKLPELVPFLADVESIEEVEREDQGPGRVRLLNIWQAEKEAAPKVVRPFLTRKVLRWKDHAEWNEKDRTVNWSFETIKFDKLFKCAGQNRFKRTSQGHTRLIIRGDLEIYPQHVPGVPRFLAKRIKPKIERFIIKLVGTNLASLAKGIQDFLDQA